jgi:folate-binding protein YgfZ
VFSRDQYDALRTSAGVVSRDDRRLIALTGADRLTYLQGLLTNDVAALAPGTGCYAALLTAQGRMIADMKVLETGTRALIDVHESVASTVRDKLEQFIFSEDAQVADLSDRVRVVGLYGPSAAQILERIAPAQGTFGSMALFENRVLTTSAGAITLVRSDDVGVEGFDLVADAADASSMIAALTQAGAVRVDRDTTEVTRVEAGRPAWPHDMDDSTIPLEAGIEDRAISLTKGCYVGQEIIIRVLHRGHGRVAKRLVGLRLDEGPIPTAGDRIRSGDRDIGAVTSAVFSPCAGSPLALGYVHRDFVEPATPVVVVQDGRSQQASVVSLPLVGSSK